jgi:hypothetical protein
MKCPRCSFENRSDARFCKQCGQPLQAQAASPAPPPLPGRACPACGATAKPGARFCPRCGKPLPTVSTPSTPPSAQPPLPSPPAPPDQMPTQPSMSPFPQPSTQQPGYATPPAQPPSVTPPPPRERPPRWAWWAGGAAVFLCLIAVVAGIVFVPKLIGGGEEPTASPTPAPTEAPTLALTEPPTEAPTEPPTEIPTEAPTAVPAETPTEAPSPLAFGAQITLSVLPDTVQAGDLVTVTVTITNDGEVEFGSLRYQLLPGEWESLGATAGNVVERKVNVSPGQTDAVVFVFEALQAGTATLQANVTMEVYTPQPSTEALSSESRDVSIIP